MGVANLTPFGRELRKLRIDKKEVLYNMADKLEITPAYLSAIENGRREIPGSMVDEIAELYSLSEEQVKNLRIACIETQHKIIVNLPESCKEDYFFVETAFLFARNFPLLGDEQLEGIRKILLSVDETHKE